MGALRRIHSRVWLMCRPVLRSMSVSAPQSVDHCSFSTCFRSAPETGCISSHISRALDGPTHLFLDRARHRRVSDVRIHLVQNPPWDFRRIASRHKPDDMPMGPP
jgi:hypothetical protein